MLDKENRTWTTKNEVVIRLCPPDQIPEDFEYMPTGDHLIERCLCAWNTSDTDRVPLNFKLVGPPGVGKNAAVYELARRMKKDLYIVVGHEELTPEDLVATAVLVDDNKIEYVASPLLSAMLTGGICFIDELGKMRPKATAPLAEVLDDRRKVYSKLLNERFAADPNFRFCAASNDTDADTYDMAPWLMDRLLPNFTVEAPSMKAVANMVINRGFSSGLVHDIVARLEAKGLKADPRRLLATVPYASRIDEYQLLHKIKIGDPIELAIEHCRP